VVPAEQLLTVSIGRGPSGKALNLKHEARGAVGVMSELGQLLANLSGVVPEGLVVFVPSFGYLEQLTQHWRAGGLWDRLAQRKQVFR
jgi:chromosome transmission fidelity protein 1